MIGKEVALPDCLTLLASKTSTQASPGRLVSVSSEHLEDAALANEHLIDVQQNVTAADDDALNGEVVANIFRLAHLVVHLLRQRRIKKVCLVAYKQTNSFAKNLKKLPATAPLASFSHFPSFFALHDCAACVQAARAV